MDSDYKNRFVFIAFILILVAFGLGPIALGIDLKGGAELVYSVETAGDAKIDDLMDRAIGVIRNRIDPQGTKGYTVAPSDGRLLITMGGANNTEIERVQKLLKKQGSLEMRLEIRGDGYRRADYVKASKALSEGKDNPIEGTTWYQTADGRWILVEDKAYIKGDMLKTVQAHPDPQDPTTWVVDLQFDAAKGGVDKLREISEIAYNNGKSGMSIILNDLWNEAHTELIRQGTCDSSPSVQSVFTNGGCVISGDYDHQEALDLVTILDSGSLPFLIKPESSVIVGPTLGQESIEKGKMSCVVGLLLVFVFMFFYYGRLGFIANLCLLINLYIVWMGMSIFNFVLTLPGIAGVILTVGIAVDANVLIFERIKEELRGGYKLARAVATGYEKAFVTIFDSNLTTFITGVILYVFGSGAVRGFAVTLCMGIVASMFSAIYVSRAVIDWLLESEKLKNINNKRLYNGNVDFLGGIQKLAAIGSIVLVFSGLSMVWQKGRENLGIDFVGGTRLQLSFRGHHQVTTIKQGAEEALKQEQFVYQDAQIIPVQGPEGPSDKGYRQFIVKTKNINNEEVEDALIAHFGDLLQPRSLDVNEKTEPLKFVQFQFAATEVLERETLQKELREKCSDPGLLVSVGKEEKDWLVYATPGRPIREMSAFLSGALGDRLQPNNIRWDPEDPKKVVLSLVKVVKIDEFIEEIESLDPSFVGVTGETADEDSPSIQYAINVLLTLPEKIDPTQFESLVLDTGLVKTLPLEEGRIINRMLFTEMRIFTEKSPEELREKIAAEDLLLLSYDNVQGDEWIIRIAGADYAGDMDELQGEASEMLASYVSNPVIANTTIRGTVAKEMSQQALWALLWSLLAIVIYITFRFEFRFGIASIVALVHDVGISLGVLAFLNIELDLTIVGALLTIVGYSLNDTIVIFDRIRENLRLWAAKPAREVINISINQTLSRTLLTSITTLLVVCVLNFYGGDELKPFSAALIIGIISGTYSSIFVASPLLLLFGGKLRSGLKPVKKKKEESEEMGEEGDSLPLSPQTDV